MTMQEFRREWENIDDRFVLEAAGMQEKSEKRGKRGGGWGRRAALIAACICLLYTSCRTSRSGGRRRTIPWPTYI